MSRCIRGGGIAIGIEPTSPTCTPTTAPPSNNAAAAAKAGSTSTPAIRHERRAAAATGQGDVTLPWLRCCGALADAAPAGVSRRNSSRVTGRQISGGVSRHPGHSASSVPARAPLRTARGRPLPRPSRARKHGALGVQLLDTDAAASQGSAPTIATSIPSARASSRASVARPAPRPHGMRAVPSPQPAADSWASQPAARDPARRATSIARAHAHHGPDVIARVLAGGERWLRVPRRCGRAARTR